MKAPLPILFALAMFLGIASLGCSADADGDFLDVSEDEIIIDVGIRGSRQKLDEAVQVAKELDERKAKELAVIGPALLPAEQGAFMRAFDAQSDVRKAYEDYITASRTLRENLVRLELNSLADVMRPAGVGGRYVQLPRGSYGAIDLYKDYVALAGTPEAAYALRFAAKLIARDPAYKVLHSRDVVKEIVEPALARAVGNALLQDKGVAQAIAAVKTVVGTSHTVFNEVFDLAGLYHQTHDAADVFKRARNVSILGKSIEGGARGLMAIIAIWDFGQAGLSRDGSLKSAAILVQQGADTTAALAMATKFYREVIRGAPASKTLANISNVAGRVSAGAGIVLQTIQLIEDAKKWNGETSDKVIVISDIISIAGGAAILVGAQTVGSVLLVGAVAVSLYAKMLHDQEVAEFERVEKQKLLKIVFPSRPLLAVNLAKADRGYLSVFRDRYDILPNDMKWIVENNPRLVVSYDYSYSMIGEIDSVTTLFGIQNAKGLMDFERAIGGTASTDDARSMREFFTYYIGMSGGIFGTFSQPTYQYDEALQKRMVLSYLDSGIRNEEFGYDRFKDILPKRELWAKTFSNVKQFLSTKM